jgi:hypothetical protein
MSKAQDLEPTSAVLVGTMFLLRHLDTYILRYSLTRNPAFKSDQSLTAEGRRGKLNSGGKEWFL